MCVCSGFALPVPAHLHAWIALHRHLGVDKFLLHDDSARQPGTYLDTSRRQEDAAAVASILAPLRAQGVVEMLPTSRWHWREEIPIRHGLRARFVGQTDVLTRCLERSTAIRAARSVDVWLVSIDLDEYMMPSAGGGADLSIAFDAAVNAVQPGATTSPGCLSIRRHNFYTEEDARAAGLPSISTHRGVGAGVFSERLWRAPFPPAGGPWGGQPFLPKWVLRLSSLERQPRQVVNMHAVWETTACHRHCSHLAPQWNRSHVEAHADHKTPGAEGVDLSKPVSDAWADPAGISALLPAARHRWDDSLSVLSTLGYPLNSGPGEAPAEDGAQMSARLIASLLSPLAADCSLPKGSDRGRCALSHRTVGFEDPGDAALLAECLGHLPPAAGTSTRRLPPVFPEPFACWVSPCARGAVVERFVRINHYGHQPLPEQNHSYDLPKAGPAVYDAFAEQLARARSVG